MSTDLSSSESDVSTGPGEGGLTSSPAHHLTSGDRESVELSGGGIEEGKGGSSDDGSVSSSVVVAQPPRGSAKERGLPEIALTGREALDVLDQVLKQSISVHNHICTHTHTRTHTHMYIHTTVAG